MHKENRQRVSNGNGVSEAKYIASQSTVFWSPGVLELVEFILRPPEGGPPILPEYSDAVFLYLSLCIISEFILAFFFSPLFF